MSSRLIYSHDPAANFTVGTVGVPGERVFFLQVDSQAGVTTVSLEKNQVAALAERLHELVTEVRRSKLASIDELNLAALTELAPLQFPLDEEFRAGIMGISWDSDRNLIAIEIQALSDFEVEEIIGEDEILGDESDLPDLLKFTIRIFQAKGFASIATKLVEAGRAACPFCGLPVDPNGHLCPRANGYRR
jgi:uncharacterized repeat protein (TIGR03847 family)